MSWLAKLLAPILPAILTWIWEKAKTAIDNWQAKRAKAKAVDQGVENQDQRPIEQAMGSDQAGKPSGISGTEIRDQLPGVKE